MTAPDSAPSRSRFLQALGLGALAVHAAPAGALLDRSAKPPRRPSQLPSEESMLGAYGEWGSGLAPDPPLFSLRRGGWERLDEWRAEARTRLLMRIASPEVVAPPVPEAVRQHECDGLHIEVLQWPMPYGPPVEGVLLKPAGAAGPLPGVLALHDHGGDKWHGWRKVADAGDGVTPMVQDHWDWLYSGRP